MAEIRLYGPIGKGFDTFSGVQALSASWLAKELAKAKGDVELLINSDGGDVFEAKAMMEEINRHQARVTAIVVGIAASAATFLPMAADSVLIAPGAQFMIHDPWTFSVGNAAEMRRTADLLENVRENTIMPAYLERARIDEAELRQMLADETWLSSERTVELGFADGLSREPAEPVEALLRTEMYSKVPETLCTAAKFSVSCIAQRTGTRLRGERAQIGVGLAKTRKAHSERLEAIEAKRADLTRRRISP